METKIEGIEYLEKEAIGVRSCYGCAFNTRSPSFCGKVRCFGIVFVENTPEAITRYLELKLTRGEVND